jgi:hypothetical protein
LSGRRPEGGVELFALAGQWTVRFLRAGAHPLVCT